MQHPNPRARQQRYRSTAALALALAGCAAPATQSFKPGAPPQQVAAISAEERQLGSKAHPDLLNEFGGAYAGPQAAYVARVGSGIAVQSGLGNARDDFTVTLLNSPVNNAFAIPGGYVYVTRQLVALMSNEAELAGVLGHEVGHVAARHSQKRQSAAQRNAILGVLGQIGSQLLLGDSTLGQIVSQGASTGSQLLTLRYSRSQEIEADDLGVEYLRRAGYDPNALATMLASLAAQSALDARVAGGDARSLPSWASTHPEPASRVSRAATRAGPASTGRTDREAFLGSVDGILYGDDPKQGVIEGRSFLHPDLRFAFEAPAGFTLQNTARAVNVSGQSGKAQLLVAPYGGNLRRHVESVFASLGTGSGGAGIAPAQLETSRVNGLDAAYGTARVSNGSQTLDVVVFAYQLSPQRALHFVAIAAAGGAGVFQPMFASMRPLTAAEATQIRPRRLRVVTVARGDTVDSLAARMAFDDLKRERFLVLNGLSAATPLQAGQKVKIVSY